MQKLTSKSTSVNKSKLPKIVKKINWTRYKDQKVFDFGGGKFDNLKDFLKENYNIDLLVYDLFNRTEEENRQALEGLKYCHAIICSNVLNVIDCDDTVRNIIKDFFIANQDHTDIYVNVYEGDRSNVGKQTGSDQYQRNQKMSEYLKIFNDREVNPFDKYGMTKHWITQRGMIANVKTWL